MFFQPLPGHFDVDGNFVLCRDFGVGTTAPDGLGMTLDRVALLSSASNGTEIDILHAINGVDSYGAMALSHGRFGGFLLHRSA
jgi:hypothetical protein